MTFQVREYRTSAVEITLLLKYNADIEHDGIDQLSEQNDVRKRDFGPDLMDSDENGGQLMPDVQGSAQDARWILAAQQDNMMDQQQSQ